MLSAHRTALRFGSFRFEPLRLRLRHGNQTLTLRPKTAALLALLLERRNTVVSKREIAGTVWGGGFVSDQSLFQAMSELRRALAPLDPIVTHPNVGYCWVAPVRSERGRVRAAAALVLLGLGCATYLATGAGESGSVSAVSTAALPPALDAFQAGLRHMAEADPRGAEAWFRLALQENPGFDEARLMTAEALLAQGQVGAAHDLAQSLLPSDAVAPDGAGRSAYTAVAAMALLGRSALSAGHDVAGLRWSQAAAGQAREAGFLCVAAEIEDRIDVLLNTRRDAAKPQRSPAPPTDAGPFTASRLLTDGGGGPMAVEETAVAASRTAAKDALPSHCRQMRGAAPRDARPGHTGQCLDAPTWLSRERRRYT